jgi:outer membrane protein assembly factor BamB
MVDNINDSVQSKASNSWYQSAVGAAIVAGVFLVIVICLLGFTFYQIKITDENRALQLEAMKKQLSSQPNDEKLLTQIRKLDLRIRRDRIRRRTFLQRGAFLATAALVVFFAALKIASLYQCKLPSLRLSGDSRAEQVKTAMRTRFAVTIGLVLLGSVSLFLAMSETIEFEAVEEDSKVAEIFYPSMDEVNANWPGFRGPSGSGVSAYTNIPTKWDNASGEGILWKSKIELPGHNSPIVWDDKVFISGAAPNNRQIFCYDTSSGKLLWKGNVVTPRGSNYQLDIMEGTGFAANTMVTDGRRVCGIFANGDIGCFDYEGKRLWCKNLGEPDSAYGYASSLAAFENMVLVQYDHGDGTDGKSKMFALDWMTGRVVWQNVRNVPNSWTSPIVAKVEDHYQIITSGSPWVIAYNPRDGGELWRADCLGGDVAPSPIYVDGKVLAIEPYNQMVAIRAIGAAGDVTETNIEWAAEDDIPDICSPVSDGELVFLLTTDGYLTCYDMADGANVWTQQLKDEFHASCSIVGDKLYVLSTKGLMIIAKASREYTELGRCELGEECFASPAFADGRIYIRGLENLYCIGGQF